MATSRHRDAATPRHSIQRHSDTATPSGLGAQHELAGPQNQANPVRDDQGDLLLLLLGPCLLAPVKYIITLYI
jgi:hypothetical protein